MDRDRVWLDEGQFARLEPHLPTDTRRKPRVDDRRVISGIIHVLKSGARWADAPALYGPKKTLSSRYTALSCLAAMAGAVADGPHVSD
jgi:transposase